MCNGVKRIRIMVAIMVWIDNNVFTLLHYLLYSFVYILWHFVLDLYVNFIG